MDIEFLELLDALHIDQANALSVPNADYNFRSYHNISFFFADEWIYDRFRIQKNRFKGKLLLINNEQQVYLSDSQIIATILEMPVNIQNWFVEQLILLYKNAGIDFKFQIVGQTFVYKGIKPFPEKKAIFLPSDTLVDINDFIILINFIFAKDICWERIPLSKKAKKKVYTKDGFSKTTLCKFISLIDFYGLHNARSLLYLNRIGYPLPFNYPGQLRGEKNMFAHTDMFEISNYL